MVALDTDATSGLSAARAAKLLAADGPNALPGERPVPGWRRFAGHYRGSMQIMLCVTAVVCLLLEEWTTAVLVLVLTVVNAVVGLRQEGKAESAVNALQAMMQPAARVRRDGMEAVIRADQLVVGDVVLLAAGDHVPADGRIISANALRFDRAGRTDRAFTAASVTHGSGTMVVTATGADTELGRISGLLRARTPPEPALTRELELLSRWVAGAAGLTMLVMFAMGRSRGQTWEVLFASAVSLAIAAIPEALPTVTEVILSAGGVELARRNAIVKDLSALETLGLTSAINADKTGTLTMNQMTVVEILDATDRHTVTGTGYSLEGGVQRAAGAGGAVEDVVVPLIVANDAALVDGRVVGDPTEGALLVLGHKAGLDIEATRRRLPRLATLPFDPDYKLMATFHDAVDADGRPVVRCFVKGSASAVAARSVPWNPELARRRSSEIERIESEGRRVVAAARRDLDAAMFDPHGDLLAYLTDLEMTGLVGMVDPPRVEAHVAVARAHAAHIRVRMVTADDVTTAAALARKLGIPGRAIPGADFAALGDEARLAEIDDIGVLGSVTPEHKVLLADTLKRRGDVVAMTGGGLDDAAAIKAADIGIAMGGGTDVAKHASRMILSDDNFATLVHAVGQGRKIYDNLTKYIRFVLLLLIAFILTFLGASVFHIAHGKPFNPAQDLWIHFFVSAAFGFALGFDRESPGLMSRRPNPPGQRVLSRPLLVTVGLVGLGISSGLLALMKIGTETSGSVPVGESIAFTAFALMLIVAAFECRSETGSIFTLRTFDSRQMNRTAAVEFVLAVLTTQSDALRRLLGTTELDMRQFRWALVPPLALLLLWELGKYVARATRTG